MAQTQATTGPVEGVEARAHQVTHTPICGRHARGCLPLQLATHTRMTKQALNYLLGQLEELGYLTREPDDDDQRSKRIRLTPRGHALTKAIREIVQGVEDEWQHQLGPRKFEQLRDLLTQLYAIATPTHDRA